MVYYFVIFSIISWKKTHLIFAQRIVKNLNLIYHGQLQLMMSLSLSFKLFYVLMYRLYNIWFILDVNENSSNRNYRLNYGKSLRILSIINFYLIENDGSRRSTKLCLKTSLITDRWYTGYIIAKHCGHFTYGFLPLDFLMWPKIHCWQKVWPHYTKVCAKRKSPLHNLHLSILIIY